MYRRDFLKTAIVASLPLPHLPIILQSVEPIPGPVVAPVTWTMADDLGRGINFKMGIWEHEDWLNGLVGCLLNWECNRFHRMRVESDGTVVAQNEKCVWLELGTIQKLIQEIENLSNKVSLDDDERELLLERLSQIERMSAD